MLNDLSLVTDEGESFTVLLHNGTARWRIVEGRVEESDPGMEVLIRGLDRPSEQPASTVITVFLNNRCNLRCDYCRFDKLTHHAIEHGSLNVARVVAAIEALAAKSEATQVHFQGGEPFLEVDAIDEVCRRLASAEIGQSLSYHVTTNGTVLTPRVLDVLETHAIQTTLSLDGVREEHDRHRYFANGSGSYDRAVKTAQALRERKLPFGVFCVVSNPSRMLAMRNYMVNELGLTSFLLAPLELDGLATPKEIDEYMTEFVRGQFLVLEANMSRFKLTGERISENLTETYLRSKIFPGQHSKACGNSPRSACGSQMHSIERNGDVVECQNTRMIQTEGPEYIEQCLDRFGICETCEIRAHCSSPVCFSRLSPAFVQEFAAGTGRAMDYIDTACQHFKRREMLLFKLFYERKEEVLEYFFAES